jgi:cytochrome oxidase assembly protein ShyY1
MLRIFLRPKWILFHLGIALLVFIMINLAFWQVRRLDQKKDFNREVTSHSQTPPQPLSKILTSSTNPKLVEWIPVHLTGTYQTDLAVTVVNRSQNGTAGVDTMVPLKLDDGTYVLVNRGFIPLSMNIVKAPPGSVAVTGYLRVSEKRGVLGATDNTASGNRTFQREDVPLISQALKISTSPMWIQMINESPSTGEWPAPVAFPELSEGPHFSYAVQWCLFSAIAIFGWGFQIRRKALEIRRGDSTTVL